MKFRVTMKTPDALSHAISEAVANEVKSLPLDDDEREAVSEKRHEKAKTLCRRWFRYSEYLTVEIDTEAMTCIVVNA